MNRTEEPNLSGCKVLVVEDNPSSLELLRIYMESLEGVQVFSAADGPTGLRLAERNRPDVILLDVMMPGMSGFEVCRRIKDQPSTRNIVVLIVTALDTQADLERAAECRADGFFSKPIDRGMLLDRVRRALVLQKRKRELKRSGGRETP
jgi:two-component system cell cycle response regulator